MLTEQGEREHRAERQSLRYHEQERKQTEELVRSRRAGECPGGKEGRGQGRGEGETNAFHFISVHFGQIEQKLQAKKGGNRA